ncbi:NAD(P)-dependent dehydrogenase, short-chain alcohol dehydrogenase family [Paracoccus alcaliphilus]|uniref:NAD(P)-dependent dehydrogenase, short-chain alcohol dehydrogenase family n=1 Tax=Paracoccus alcaliphilus TaxID=34002 RepID=A0A1H8HEU8_9RHOB|nr:SDR family oxidoreductase [Paracoccus alcaliphilus]WCR20693.1 SDR family oxidoreductase [Paracoccus alcaliphilus]SEN54792.1 NAD(P)-dependent dehydrogenase, short-chain alcohol dehydrogenase family [Paracoccus alcaliphilus]
MQFSGKSVIITGAGKGIGRACAKVMAERGARVVALSRTQSDLDSLEAETGARGIRVDLADVAATRAAMAGAGTCDFLINSAGINVLESVTDMTEAGYEAVLGINLRAALITCQEFARARIAAGGGGAIVNITSIAGHRGFQDHLCYAASKAGLEGASRVMAKELGPHGIRVNCVAPTITLTELAAEAWSDPQKSQPMMVRHPLNRFAEADEVATAIALLLSPGSAMISGAVLPVDGGFLSV